MEYISRDIELAIQRHVAGGGDEILLLAGARQTGKSTMLHNISLPARKTIVNLWDEEPEIAALRNASTLSSFEQYLHTFFQFKPDGSSVLIIDEAQASRHLSSFLMEMHRTWKGQKVILSGSLLTNLYADGRPLPVGRTVELVCRPLNFGEFLRFRKKEDYFSLMKSGDGGFACEPETHAILLSEYELYLQIGGMPGIVSSNEEKRDTLLLLDSLLGALYKDADRFISIEPSRTPQYGSVLETVFKNVALHIGQPTQNTTLLSSDSPAYRTVLPRVTDAMKAWNLLYVLEYETAALTTKKGYSSKKYLYDVGIANFVINRFLPVKLGDSSPVVAALLENALLQDIAGMSVPMKNIRCYRSSNRVPSELDFVVYVNDTTLPIEVKSSVKVNKKSLSQLLGFCTRKNLKSGYVVYGGPPKTEEYNGVSVTYIPPYMLYPMISRML